MRKPDREVSEVVCSETGKPMPKIPPWMAGMKVRFVSDEARQKHPAPLGIPDLDPIRKTIGGGDEIDELKDFAVAGAAIEPEGGFDEVETESDEPAEEEYEA